MPIKERFLKGLSIFKVSRKSALKFLSLTLIFIIAFLIRAFPVLKHGYNIRAYDPYLQFFTAEYIRKHGLKAFFMLFDTQAWAPGGRKVGTFYIGVNGMGALLHFALTSLGFDVSLIAVVALIPPLFGALSAIAIYGGVRDLSNERAALFSAFIAAISMGMIRRSIAGFFDNDAIGVFFLLMSLWMFIRGMKKKSIIYPLFSGIFLALLSWTWGANKYLFGLYTLFALLLLLTSKIDSTSAMTYATTMIVAIGLRVVLPANYGSLTDTVVLFSLAVTTLCILYFVAIFMGEAFSFDKDTTFHWLVGGAIGIAIIGGIALYLTGHLGGVGTKYFSILNPTVRDQLPAFSSVSENQPAPWSSVFRGVFLPIIFAPLGVYYFFEKRSKRGGFFVLCILTAFYFSSSISRLVVMFSPFFAMAAGVGIDYLLGPLTAVLKKDWILHKVRPVRRRLGEVTLPRGEAIVGYALVGLVLFLTIYHTRQNVKASQFSTYDISDGERKVFQYLRTHASRSDRVAAWWDYGYRLRYKGHVTTIVDNFTNNFHAMGTIGAMLMLPPSKSMDILRSYKVKYVVVYRVDLQKAQWMIKISSNHAPEWGVERDSWYDNKTNKYKAPFFRSTLWRLVAAQMKREAYWVKGSRRAGIPQLGVDALKDRAQDFQVSSGDLNFFKLIKVRQKPSQGSIWLYRVQYRTPIDTLPLTN